MKVDELLEIYATAIRDISDRGAESVSVSELRRLNAEIVKMAAQSPSDASAGEAAMERYRGQLAADLEHYRGVNAHNLEMLRATISTGQSALRSALLINGAAAVAVLAFLGNAWAKDAPRQTLAGGAYGLSLFVWGVLAAATAIGATYVSQAGFGDEFGRYSQKIGALGRGLAILLVVASYALFSCAAWRTYLSLVG